MNNEIEYLTCSVIPYEHLPTVTLIVIHIILPELNPFKDPKFQTQIKKTTQILHTLPKYSAYRIRVIHNICAFSAYLSRFFFNVIALNR